MIKVTRRQFMQSSLAASALAGLPACTAIQAKTVSDIKVLKGSDIQLTIAEKTVNFSGVNKKAIVVNDSLAGPTLRFKEGDTVCIQVTNTLADDTSIHWHGIVLPSVMDGVPGLSFAGIKPGESFLYQFTLKQNGTYWYHSHSGWQEQQGLYGAIVIEAKEAEPFSYDKDFVVLLSEWSDENPEQIFMNLHKNSEYYQKNKRTLAQTFADIERQGLKKTWQERKMWNEMRMSEADISDVTGATYQYLMNGNANELHWRGIFSKGDVIRLRFINASAMTFFDVRIPGLVMTVIAADGQLIQPVEIDEFRIGNAETYDVLVKPTDSAYTIFAQAMDRTGYAMGTLAIDDNSNALIPKLDAVPVLGHDDMGMSMKSAMMYMPNMDMSSHGMSISKIKMGTGVAGYGSALPIVHSANEYGANIEARAELPQYRLDDPGVGLRLHQKKLGRKVLTYAMLKNLHPTQDKRQASREIQMHLTGSMRRYAWSIDGVNHAEPIQLKLGERIRITLVNDTMMNHPIHLHGLWSELETGDADFIPRKHTIIVQPGSKISYLVTADTEGDWAFHCHLLYHMAAMFRVVRVVA